MFWIKSSFTFYKKFFILQSSFKSYKEAYTTYLGMVNMFIKLHVSIINGFNLSAVGGGKIAFCEKIDDVTNLNGRTT